MLERFRFICHWEVWKSANHVEADLVVSPARSARAEDLLSKMSRKVGKLEVA